MIRVQSSLLHLFSGTYSCIIVTFICVIIRAKDKDTFFVTPSFVRYIFVFHSELYSCRLQIDPSLVVRHLHIKHMFVCGRLVINTT